MLRLEAQLDGVARVGAWWKSDPAVEQARRACGNGRRRGSRARMPILSPVAKFGAAAAFFLADLYGPQDLGIARRRCAASCP